MLPRLHLFELLDYEWFPSYLRNLLTDFLSFIWSLKLARIGFNTSPVETISDLVEEVLSSSDAQQIVDLCSGSGGPPALLYKILNKRVQKRIKVSGNDQSPEFRGLLKCPPIILTDRYPNTNAFRQLAQLNSDISFEEDAVDALTCSFSLPTFRTLFNGFHHFTPHNAQQIISSAVDNGDGIGIFELSSRKFFSIVLTMFGLPLLTLFFTPFIRPIRFGRYVFTYLIPVIPICQSFNGTVSCLRAYTQEELLYMAQKADPEQKYEWKYQSHFVGFLRVTSFLGYLRKAN